MTTVVTGWHPKGYALYGRNFIESFCAHWPSSVGLACYTEEPMALPRNSCRSVWDCDGVLAFVKRHASVPEHCGRAARAGWKIKERTAGYSYRFDAVKFCKQLMIPSHAAESLPDGEILVWLDADVVTYKPVPPMLVESLIGDADMTYLGRDGTHSEIGFWAVRLSGLTRTFLGGLSEMYTSDRVFTLPEWHSAFVFDVVRQRFEKHGMTVKNLTPGGRGHVFASSPLAFALDHLKGKRKLLGRSPEARR